jgi:hypothetical protein
MNKNMPTTEEQLQLWLGQLLELSIVNDEYGGLCAMWVSRCGSGMMVSGHDMILSIADGVLPCRYPIIVTRCLPGVSEARHKKAKRDKPTAGGDWGIGPYVEEVQLWGLHSTCQYKAPE